MTALQVECTEEGLPQARHVVFDPQEQMEEAQRR